jgi:hypothetical protein
MSLISSGVRCIVLSMATPSNIGLRSWRSYLAPRLTVGGPLWSMSRRDRRSGPKLAVIAAGIVLVAVLGLGLLVVSASPSSTPASMSLGSIPGPAAPPSWQMAEVDAASSCPSLSWSVLGALGWMATGSGRAPGTVDPPWWHWPGGLFGVDPTPTTLHDTSVIASARDAAGILCVAMLHDGSLEAALEGVLGDPSAVLQINVVATSLNVSPDLSAGRATAIEFAAGALGLPYQWGGNGPSSYDCSGLVVASYRAAGIALPRTAQEQHDVTQVVLGAGEPGDLVFFGAGSDEVSHVGIEIGDQLMIDAPETGELVRIEDEGWSDLVSRGSVSP